MEKATKKPLTGSQVLSEKLLLEDAKKNNQDDTGI